MICPPQPDRDREAREKLTEMMYGWRKGKMRELGIPLTDRRNAHPERDIQNAILQWLMLKKICHVRLAVNSSQIMAGGKMIRLPNPMRGWPDILCVYGKHGTAVGLEVKASTQQSDEQKEVQKYIESANGVYRVVRRLEEVIELFGQLEKTY